MEPAYCGGVICGDDPKFCRVYTVWFLKKQTEKFSVIHGQGPQHQQIMMKLDLLKGLHGIIICFI